MQKKMMIGRENKPWFQGESSEKKLWKKVASTCNLIIKQNKNPSLRSSSAEKSLQISSLKKMLKSESLSLKKRMEEFLNNHISPISFKRLA